jgi:hypothetical protein
VITSSLPLRAAIAQSKLLPERYRKQLLHQHDSLLLAVVELCMAEPDWSAGKVSSALVARFPTLNERLVCELRKIIRAKHAKRRRRGLQTLGPNRQRLRIEAGGFVLGAWYEGRAHQGQKRQLLGVLFAPDGELMVGYRVEVDAFVYRMTYRSWGHWVGNRVERPAAGRHTCADEGFRVQDNTEQSVECEAA